MRKTVEILFGLLPLVLLGVTTGFSEVITSRKFDVMYVVSNEVHCIVREDKFLNMLRYPTIEGDRSLINEQVQQKFEVWRFTLKDRLAKPSVAKIPLASFKADKANSADVVFGTSLMVWQEQQRGPVLKVSKGVFDCKTKVDLKFDLNQVIAFDRTWEHAVIPWQNGVAVVKMASLTNNNPDVVLQTNWNAVLQFPKESYNQAILSRDGSRLIFFPEGSSSLCCHVLVLGDHDTKKINLPPGLSWNDVIDADVVNGKVLFVTRNLGSQGDSYQIADASWKLLANLPSGEGWFRPTWDIDGMRLLFPEMSPSTLQVNAPIQFRIWDYHFNKEMKITVQ